MLLHEIADPIDSLPGIGSRRRAAFARLGTDTMAGLLTLLPRRYEDRSRVISFVEAARRGEGVVDAAVHAHEYFHVRRKRTLKIMLRDDTATAALVCFGRNVLAQSFPVGTRVRVYGQFALRYGEIQSSTFELDRIGDDPAPPDPPFAPVYPLAEGLTQTHVREAVRAALQRYTDQLDDELPPRVRRAGAEATPQAPVAADSPDRIDELPNLATALRLIHAPRTLDEADRGRRRLVWGELFVFQLRLAREALQRRRRRRRARPAPTRSCVGPLIEALPFDLTDDQSRVFAEITDDMRRPWPMSRLLQGDVGSGKTLVALLAALAAIERGGQVAFMVPTELLARQHARNIGRMVAERGVHTALALGSMPGSQRASLAAALRDGEVDLVIGTHALFSQDFGYANLSLAVIDEQHRFGVAQREALTSLGHKPDVLMMSATPIPRSLALTAFGDSEVSTIRSLPPGRRPVRTHLTRMGNEARVYAIVRDELEAGRQAYLVYPAIEEGGARGLRAATAMAGRLRREFAPYSVGLVHSQLDEVTRADTMDRFAAGEISALVATSVVEVGVDVPNATVMVVEHAEVFGLAALHQLRGRVGRGGAQSYCHLVYQEPLTDDGRERLRVMYESNDGFFIAEEDLRIRGPGELQGSRQSGFLEFRFADLRRDMDTMIAARAQVAKLLKEDPELAHEDHAPLRRALEAAHAD